MTQPVGPIKYAPFEDLDAYSHRQILHFGVYPFGNIADYCAQVPYSSDKRDVFEKTGRECLRGKFSPLARGSFCYSKDEKANGLA